MTKKKRSCTGLAERLGVELFDESVQNLVLRCYKWLNSYGENEEKQFIVGNDMQQKYIIFKFFNTIFTSNRFLLPGRVTYIIVSKIVGRPTWKTCFHSFTVHLHIITYFICPTDCTTRLFERNVKTYIKTYIKMFLHVLVYKPSSECPCESVRSCGCSHTTEL